jgi:hypothetical protein
MPSQSEIDSLMVRLSEAPPRIAHATTNMSDRALHCQLGTEWSAAQIFAHIRASDDILTYRCYLILAHDHPHYHDLDERRWEAVVRYSEMTFVESLRAFSVRRAELVRLLRRASTEEWSRAGTHTRRGEQTLWMVASYLGEHEQEHIAQLDRLAARVNLLSAIAAGQRLKDHRDIEGHKTYVLHRADDTSEPVDPADVEELVELGLISSNKKFPAATYWLTEKGEKLIEQQNDERNT